MATTTTISPPPDRSVRAVWQRQGGLLACLGVVALLSLLLNATLVLHGHWSDTLMTTGGDVAEQVWFLGWLPHALAHGLNPFVSQAVFAGSGGANLMVNTSIFFPALFLTPLTWLGGPILAFNVGVLLVPVVCAWPMYAMARRFTASVVVATVAATLWVLSPYVVTNLSSGHFHQTVTAFPPLVLLLALDLMEGRRGPVRTGVYAGLAIVAQYFTGSELLAMTFLEGGLALLAVLLVRRSLLVRHARVGLQALGVAAGVATLCMAYPLWVEFLGPRHVTGKPWGSVFDFGVPLATFVSAPLGLGHGARLTNLWLGSGSAAAESLAFLGWGFILAALVAIVACWRRAAVRALALVGVVTALLTLGATVQLHGPASTWFAWGPWRLLNRVPVLEELIPNRLVQPLGLIAIVLMVIGAESARRRLDHHPPVVRVVAGLLAITIVALPQVLAADAPFPALSVSGTFEPSFFVHYGHHPGPLARLLVFPAPTSGLGTSAAAMTYQARSNFSYDLASAYLLVPTTGSTQSAWRVPPTGNEGLLDNLVPLFQGSTIRLTSSQRATLAATLRQRRVTTVALVPTLTDHHLAVAELTAILGSRPHRDGDTWYWQLRPNVPPLQVSSATIMQCFKATMYRSLGATARCVWTHRTP
jgi:hypothetical protein